MSRTARVVLLAVVAFVAGMVFLLLGGALRRPLQEKIIAPSVAERTPGEPVLLFDSLAYTHFAGDELPDIDLSWPQQERDLSDERIRGAARFRLETGWAIPEHWGVWALGSSSTLSLYLPAPGRRHLLLDCWAIRRPRRELRQVVSVTLNGQPSGSFEIGKRFRKRHVSLPIAAQAEGANSLTLSYTYSATAKSLGLGDDTLPLSVGYRAIQVAAGDEPPSLPARIGAWLSSFRTEDRRQRAGVGFDQERGRLVFRRPGTLVVPVRLPADAEALELTAYTGAPAPAWLSLVAERLDGGRVRLLQCEADPVAAAQAPFFSGKVAVGELAGETCLLVFEVGFGGGPAGGGLELDPPLLRLQSAAAVAATAAPEEETGRSGAGAPVPRPDIVLITLDAARADHVGCYGYHRATTPNIDRIAAGSLVYTNAYATAPYTLCSVPTMLTGLSFLDHGVTLSGHRLAAQANTLAEYLRGAGYRTICFSATPNNSRALATDQGYDEFHEVWREVDQSEAIDPHRLSRLVIERLRADDSAQPLHLQIHYVPPHEPYAPGERFDRFGERSPDDSYDGSLATISAVNAGIMIPDERDLARVVALYDGNLARVDDAVGLLLAALKERPQWSRTAVVITSDHGEALYEHGRIGHNTTVFDEMLRVPLLLRLPEAAGTKPGVQRQLATLADLTPTLLGLAGLRPQPGVAGTDLLGRQRTGQNDRFFVVRTTAERAAYAIRTDRWKAWVTLAGSGVLYDLENDPGERQNVVLDHGPLFRGLMKLLQARLAAPPSIGPGTGRAAPDHEERAMLEALGYLD